MKKTIALLATSQAYAQCIGSGAYSACIDPRTGDLSETLRIGNQTFTEGSNSRTGSTWKESGYDMGNIQTRKGRTGDGKRYESTTHDLGSTQLIRSFMVGGERINCMVTSTTVICN